MYFETIADLIAQASVTPGIEYIVGGFYKPGDGGGGTFIWIPPGAHPDPDGGIIFNVPLDPSGYFQRVFSGPINVRWFGAIRGATDPNPPPGYPSIIYDVTPYVHRARDSQEFANNGTLYFPKGDYPGAFVITAGSPSYTGNELNNIGDGQGTVLMSTNTSAPILSLGYKVPTWRYAKVANLKIDGLGYGWDGIRIESAGTGAGKSEAGRWIFDNVLFMNCARAVDKPAGNIGNHFIDCTWRSNTIGIYAKGEPNRMHSGCDRYTGGHFDKHSTGAIYYEDTNGGGGQIILDGTIFEGNSGFAIKIKYTGAARFSQCAISIRNVYFEHNGQGDMHFKGVRSVRIEDCTFFKLTLIESSVNLYNCAHETGGYPNDWIQVDDKSSLVAYEQRYFMYPNENIFVNSISYDATPELGDWRHSAPAPEIGSSVWGPLRAVTATKIIGIAVSTHFDGSPVAWEDYSTGTPYGNSSLSNMLVLGKGSNWLSLGPGDYIWATGVRIPVKGGKYTVWSIHTYTEDTVEYGEFYGEIITENPDRSVKLGEIYFKQNQWACTYGMRYVENDFVARIAFNTQNSATSKAFYITDFQIIQFDDLASANSFVNSKEFAIYTPRP